MKLIRKIIPLILLINIFFTACTRSKDVEYLTIGILPSVDAIPILMAENLGYFEALELPIKIIPFKSAMDRDTALQTNQLDGVTSDMLSVVFFRDNGFDVTITSATEGVFKILSSSPNIKMPMDISNHSIGISSNTIIEYITDVFIDTYQLNIEKVSIPQMPVRLEMLNTGKIDLATLPDPLATAAENTVILATSATLETNPAIMLFRNQSINDKGTLIDKFYTGYNQAIEYINSTPTELMEETIIDLGDFPESLKGILDLPNFRTASLPDALDWEKVLQWMHNKGLTKNTYTFEEITTDLFVK